MIRNAWVETVGNVDPIQVISSRHGRLTVLVRDILPLAVSVQLRPARSRSRSSASAHSS